MKKGERKIDTKKGLALVFLSMFDHVLQGADFVSWKN